MMRHLVPEHRIQLARVEHRYEALGDHDLGRRTGDADRDEPTAGDHDDIELGKTPVLSNERINPGISSPRDRSSQRSDEPRDDQAGDNSCDQRELESSEWQLVDRVIAQTRKAPPVSDMEPCRRAPKQQS